MNSKVTIVMYHYVRDLKHTRYPKIKGMDLNLFEKQISYFKKHYNIVSMEELLFAIDNSSSLPLNSLLLTFDDGYIDHYTNVLPILVENGIQGSFYVPVKTASYRTLLDVNKIHFILAACTNKTLIVRDILTLLDQNRLCYGLESDEYYLKKVFVSNRYDSTAVNFIKRMLQVELNETLRMGMVDELFKKYVTTDETSFADELYMNVDQIRIMKDFGMHVGAHGFDHLWLGSLSREMQEIELYRSVDFLDRLGVDVSERTFCYPYGSYNQDTVEILDLLHFKTAFTTEPRIADFITNSKLSLPRFDTNDFPV